MAVTYWEKREGAKRTAVEMPDSGEGLILALEGKGIRFLQAYEPEEAVALANALLHAVRHLRRKGEG